MDVNKSNGDYTLLTTAEILQKLSQYFVASSYNMTLETLRYKQRVMGFFVEDMDLLKWPETAAVTVFYAVWSHGLVLKVIYE